MRTSYFNRFTLDLPEACVHSLSGQGPQDGNALYWASQIACPIDPAQVRAELKGYGAWDDEELANDHDNWQRLIWIAACNIREGERGLHPD